MQTTQRDANRFDEFRQGIKNTEGECSAEMRAQGAMLATALARRYESIDEAEEIEAQIEANRRAFAEEESTMEKAAMDKYMGQRLRSEAHARNESMTEEQQTNQRLRNETHEDANPAAKYRGRFVMAGNAVDERVTPEEQLVGDCEQAAYDVMDVYEKAAKSYLKFEADVAELKAKSEIEQWYGAAVAEQHDEQIAELTHELETEKTEARLREEEESHAHDIAAIAQGQATDDSAACQDVRKYLSDMQEQLFQAAQDSEDFQEDARVWLTQYEIENAARTTLHASQCLAAEARVKDLQLELASAKVMILVQANVISRPCTTYAPGSLAAPWKVPPPMNAFPKTGPQPAQIPLDHQTLIVKSPPPPPESLPPDYFYDITRVENREAAQRGLATLGVVPGPPPPPNHGHVHDPGSPDPWLEYRHADGPVSSDLGLSQSQTNRARSQSEGEDEAVERSRNVVGEMHLRASPIPLSQTRHWLRDVVKEGLRITNRSKERTLAYFRAIFFATQVEQFNLVDEVWESFDTTLVIALIWALSDTIGKDELLFEEPRADGYKKARSARAILYKIRERYEARHYPIFKVDQSMIDVLMWHDDLDCYLEDLETYLSDLIMIHDEFLVYVLIDPVFRSCPNLALELKVFDNAEPGTYPSSSQCLFDAVYFLGMRRCGQKLLDPDWSSSETKCWRKAPLPKRRAPPPPLPDAIAPAKAMGPPSKPTAAAPPPKAKSKAKSEAMPPPPSLVQHACVRFRRDRACKYGDRCRGVHVKNGIHEPTLQYPAGVAITLGPQPGDDCANYVATGACEHGHSCNFAHGSEDHRGFDRFTWLSGERRGCDRAPSPKIQARPKRDFVTIAKAHEKAEARARSVLVLIRSTSGRVILDLRPCPRTYSPRYVHGVSVGGEEDDERKEVPIYWVKDERQMPDLGMFYVDDERQMPGVVEVHRPMPALGSDYTVGPPFCQALLEGYSGQPSAASGAADEAADDEEAWTLDTASAIDGVGDNKGRARHKISRPGAIETGAGSTHVDEATMTHLAEIGEDVEAAHLPGASAQTS